MLKYHFLSVASGMLKEAEQEQQTTAVTDALAVASVTATTGQ
jgi:hypothetical protein